MSFFGTLGAQMAIYFMTFLFAFFMAMKNKEKLKVPFEKPKIKTITVSVLMVASGIPVAKVLNAFAGVLSRVGADSTEDINQKYDTSNLYAYGIQYDKCDSLIH